jgi:hypothetical protein
MIAGLVSRHPRAREAVRLASEGTKIAIVRAWLFEDARGTFEREASDLLADPEVLRRAEIAGLSEDQIVAAVADRLLLRALNAMLAHRRRG